ncbi:MAG: cellulase family glycosylhydrolase [Capsulimonadaceae bacterium]|nr:cellulase family glycosylhydrolase [Capsulimonadaceae bacterium]
MKLVTYLATLILLTCLPSLSSASVKRGDILYQMSLADNPTLKGWQGVDPSTISWTSTPKGSKALHISVPASGSNTVRISLPIDVSKLRGLRIVTSAMIKAAGVVKGPFPWNGVKVQLAIDTPRGTSNDQMNDVYGTFDWRELRFGSEIPTDATGVRLILGIENSPGEADFDSVRITVLEAPRDPSVKPIRDAYYTGHSEPRLRGAMVPKSLDEASATVLARDWKANVIRFIVSGTRPGGPEVDMSPSPEYDHWLDLELARLDHFLPIAQKNGLRVVFDMHSQPGGRISSFAGDRIFTDIRYQDTLATAWDKISKHYRGNRTIWGYDLCNEPLERTTPDNVPGWQDLALRLARIVRKNDPDHAIIMESMNSDPGEFKYLSPIPVSKVVYSVHMYVPLQYTHQGVFSPSKPITYPGIIAGRMWDKSALEDTLRPVVDFQKQCQASIFVGEFSAIRWAPNSLQYLRDVIDIYEANHWDWAYHAFREWQGWSAEYPADQAATAPSASETERARMLKSYFALNNTTKESRH